MNLNDLSFCFFFFVSFLRRTPTTTPLGASNPNLLVGGEASKPTELHFVVILFIIHLICSCVRHPTARFLPHHLLFWGMVAWYPFTTSSVIKENPLLSLILICCEKILRYRAVPKSIIIALDISCRVWFPSLLCISYR